MEKVVIVQATVRCPKCQNEYKVEITQEVYEDLIAKSTDLQEAILEVTQSDFRPIVRPDGTHAPVCPECYRQFRDVVAKAFWQG